MMIRTRLVSAKPTVNTTIGARISRLELGWFSVKSTVIATIGFNVRRLEIAVQFVTLQSCNGFPAASSRNTKKVI